MQRRILIPSPLAGLPSRLPQGELLEATGLAMGTSWTVKWVQEAHIARPSVINCVEAALALVINEMSTWQADSWVSRFNTSAAGSRHPVPPHAARVLDCALAIAADSQGAFDPTVGPLVNLWGFGPIPAQGAQAQSVPPRTAPPSQSEIADIKALCGWWRVEVDGGSVRQPGGLYLDFSGIAKGYSVDLIAASLQQLGITNFLVEVGGELYGHGIKPDGQPWWVALEMPASVTVAMQTIAALHGLAVATSGDYRRYFESANVRYSHTIDPRTGRPVAQAPSAVTVLHASCMQADAYATALTVLGLQAGMDYARRCNVAALFTILEDGNAAQYSSPALLAMEEEAAA